MECVSKIKIQEAHKTHFLIWVTESCPDSEYSQCHRAAGNWSLTHTVTRFAFHQAAAGFNDGPRVFRHPYAWLVLIMSQVHLMGWFTATWISLSILHLVIGGLRCTISCCMPVWAAGLLWTYYSEEKSDTKANNSQNGNSNHKRRARMVQCSDSGYWTSNQVQLPSQATKFPGWPLASHHLSACSQGCCNDKRREAIMYTSLNSLQWQSYL